MEAGEFAYPRPKGERPEAGLTVFVHPRFAAQLDRVPPLVLHQLVAVNYGDFVSPDDAETFGASVLGIPRDASYHARCELADELAETGAIYDRARSSAVRLTPTSS